MAKVPHAELATANQIIDRIKQNLEGKGEPLNWSSGWSALMPSTDPMSQSKSTYSGLNWLALSLMQQMYTYDSPYYVTKTWLQKNGGCIPYEIWAEHATTISWWNFPDEDKGEDFIPYCKKYKVINMSLISEWGEWKEEWVGLNKPKKKMVFHAIKGKTMPKKYIVEKLELKDHKPIDEAQAIADKYFGYNNAPELMPLLGKSTSPAYSDKRNQIYMPEMGQYNEPSRYYKTLFHEMAHSTGAKDKLNRQELQDFVSTGNRHAYSKEELTAEMTAGMLCTTAGIDTEENIENSAAYLKSWLGHLEDNPEMLVQAMKQAKKAHHFILNGKVQSYDKKKKEEKAKAK